MYKWYENEKTRPGIVVASRIRLLRNFKAWMFPPKLSDEERKEITAKVQEKLNGLQDSMEQPMNSGMLEAFSPVQRQALKERQVINQSANEKDTSVGLILSEDESVSLTINGTDHLRILVSKPGQDLEGAWNEINKLDDFVNQHFEYAFDEKFGYMTTFPTNLGTGMRAYQILHLPLLSTSRKFRAMLNEIGRCGVTVKGAFGEGQDNDGSLYVLYNQKTLGQREEDIIQVMAKMAGQLVNQERAVRKQLMKEHRLELEDSVYRSYGMLRFGRNAGIRDAMTNLSQLRLGQEEGIIELAGPCNCYKLMLGIQPANLQVGQNESTEESLNQLRADYIRSMIPKLEGE